MNIRVANREDAAEIARMAERFLSDEGPYFGRFKASPKAVERLLERMLMPTALALVLELEANTAGRLVGMFGAFVFEHPITEQKVASEICWWVDPEARGSRKAADMVVMGVAWAKRTGAAWFEMIAPNERLASFYETLGFERGDIHYLKVLR